MNNLQNPEPDEFIYQVSRTAIQGVAQQIVNCPYQGMTKRSICRQRSKN
ncbi:hypothetical protein [Nostoc sp.]